MQNARTPSATITTPSGEKFVGGIQSWGNGWVTVNGKRYPMSCMVVGTRA